MAKNIYIHGHNVTGRKLSSETKAKMSAAKRGKPLSFCSWLGKKHSPETLIKLSESHKGKILPENQKRKISLSLSKLRGPQTSQWKGGITPENKRARKRLEWRLWRESVFKRDDFTCQSCGNRGGKLHAHHLKRFSDFPELRFAIDNGQTLCENCHLNLHQNKEIVEIEKAA